MFEPKVRGIFVADSRTTRIADCAVMDRTGGSMLAAIEVVGKSPGTLICANLVSKGTQGDVLAPGATVEGNQTATS